MSLSPIVLFVYNRPWHTQQTIEALQKNTLAGESELFIYSDAPKSEEDREKVQAVREYTHSVEGFKKVTIIEREKNWGLADSIIDGVTEIVNKYGKIIVLEDDLVTSPVFLEYMNDGLERYKNEDMVASIHGYIYPILDLPDLFFIKGADCWGWATWKRAWAIFEGDGKKLLSKLKQRQMEKEADFNGCYGYTQMLRDQITGKNNSWAVRWYMSAFLKGMVTLYPGKSYIHNIGNDESGTHCGETAIFDVQLNTNFKVDAIDVIENLECRRKIEKFFSGYRKSLSSRIVDKIRRYF